MANGMVDLAVHQWSEDKKTSWIQVMTTGEWDRPEPQKDGTVKTRKVRITPADLHKFKENFDQNVRGIKLFTDIEHKPTDGAVNEWQELQVRDNGNTLWARVAWTDEGAKLVQSGKYNYFSPEFSFSWTDPATQKTYKDVLFGGALTNRPFLKNMERIAMSETADMFQLRFAEDEPFDPDHDGDNDSTANPKKNPDWMEDVRQGITPWSVCTPDQKQQLIAKGITHHVANRAHEEFMQKHPHLKMSEGGITDSHKTPPKDKPKTRDLYADPEHYKYPIDKKHIRAAVSYFNQGGMREKGGYSESEWAEIGRRIAAAASRLEGGHYEYSGGKVVTPSTHKMSDDAYDPEDVPDDEGGVATPHAVNDTDAGKYNEPGGVSMETVTMSEHQAVLDRVKLLEAADRRHKFTEQVRGWMFDEKARTGKLVPALQEKAVDLMMGMTDEQVTKFAEFVDGLPPVVSFGEAGTSANIVARVKETNTDKSDEVTKLAEEKVKGGMEWSEAFIAAADELGVEV
ncbi:phage protease [Alicyclobacillus sp. ALC3]|uniref:phage protease n=1 Tax=Alicyclobacillus sp. ALC3 TaxID=2796143 RepID=UPI0023785789|nr:phage protease [Alicyclobacillus sp. ALC3]WDL96399.1 hypothetical protein JC200_19050 [Alicyclobacillus sp. ALC3]